MENRKKYWGINLIIGFFLLFIISRVGIENLDSVFWIFIDVPIYTVGEMIGHNKILFYIMQGIVYASIGSFMVHIIREAYRLLIKSSLSHLK